MYKTISFTSGKGGVGKTNIATNMALLLAASGKKVLLLDADFGLANVDILMNIQTENNILDFFLHKCSLEETIYKYKGLEDNFHIIPGVSGIKEITDLSADQLLYLIEEVGKILSHYNFLFIDTSAGIHDSILRMNASADEIIVIVNPEPTSITDAFALMKTMYLHYNVKKFSIIYNRCYKSTSLQLFKRFNQVAGEISQLDIQLKYLGYIEENSKISQAIQNREPIIAYEPRGKTTQQIQKIMQQFYEEHQGKEEGNFLVNFFRWNR